MKYPSSIAPSVSPRASFGDLPVSSETTRATSSRSRSSSCATRRRMRPRSSTVRAAHAGCAAAAAPIAAAVSVASDLATRLSASPVAGASFSNVAPLAAARSSPPITFPTVLTSIATLTAANPRGLR